MKVEGNDWSSCCFRYHTIAAFYRLNVIEKLNQLMFSKKDLYNEMIKVFYKKYGLDEDNNKKIDVVLSTMFKNLLFYLDFFGFTKTKTVKEQRSLDAARLLVKKFENDNTGNMMKRFFAFSEIKYALKNYHQTCFQAREIPDDILDCDSYSCLKNTILFVKNAFIKLKYIPNNLESNESLIIGLLNYQKANNILSGYCDMFTLRHVFNDSFPQNGCELFALLRFSGIQIENPKYPQFKNTLKFENLNQYDGIVNAFLNNIRDFSEVPDWIISEAQNSMLKQTEKIGSFENESNNIIDETNSIEQLLNKITENNNSANSKFVRMNNTLQKAKNEVQLIQKEFGNANKRLKNIQKANITIQVFLFIFTILIIQNILIQF